MKQGTESTVKKVHELFKGKGLTLSVAESCTGGSISHYITTLPGASAFFKAGIIAYSTDIKKNILGIPEETFQQFGVVSDEMARQMAQRARIVARTDCSVSSTGNLGPDVMERKEKGLVYIAASYRDKTVSRELRLKGDRRENREEAALESLKLLLELVQG